MEIQKIIALLIVLTESLYYIIIQLKPLTTIFFKKISVVLTLVLLYSIWLIFEELPYRFEDKIFKDVYFNILKNVKKSAFRRRDFLRIQYFVS